MSLARRSTGWSSLAAALLCGALGTGCNKSSTKPETPPTTPTQHQVAVTVEDSTGARVAGTFVYPSGIDDATGVSIVNPVATDAAGVASFTLLDGHWGVFASVGAVNTSVRVAGSTGLVGVRPAPDTVLFRLVLRTQSIARGKVTLNGQTIYAGTLVGVLGVPSITQTEADGSYELDGLPPGSWTTIAGRLEFKPAQFTIVVPAPGDTVTVASIALAPGLARP